MGLTQASQYSPSATYIETWYSTVLRELLLSSRIPLFRRYTYYSCTFIDTIISIICLLAVVIVLDKMEWRSESPIQPPKGAVVFYMYIYVCAFILWLRIVLSHSEPESGAAFQGYIPMGGSSEGVYKHSAGESCASNISRLRTWDWHGPLWATTSHTSRDSRRQAILLSVCQCRTRRILSCSFCCVCG
jgi:hypothetical protein